MLVGVAPLSRTSVLMRSTQRCKSSVMHCNAQQHKRRSRQNTTRCCRTWRKLASNAGTPRRVRVVQGPLDSIATAMATVCAHRAELRRQAAMSSTEGQKQIAAIQEMIKVRTRIRLET